MNSVEIVESLGSLYPLKDFEEEAIMEVVAEFRELKEKATAKKVDVKEWIYTKCDCGYEFSVHHGDGYYSIPYERQTNYCPNCGQKLLWD